MSEYLTPPILLGIFQAAFVVWLMWVVPKGQRSLPAACVYLLGLVFAWVAFGGWYAVAVLSGSVLLGLCACWASATPGGQPSRSSRGI